MATWEVSSSDEAAASRGLTLRLVCRGMTMADVGNQVRNRKCRGLEALREADVRVSSVRGLEACAAREVASLRAGGGWRMAKRR